MGIHQVLMADGPYQAGPDITSTGGVKIENEDNEVTYHIFNYDNAPPSSAAPFTVSGAKNIYYLVVGSGGGGGYNSGGGGGAGALRSNHPDMPTGLRGAAYPVAPGTTYNIKVNAGGPAGSSNKDREGGQSELGASNPTPITSDGGGTGGNTENPGQNSPGNGSGGGGGNNYTHLSTTGGSGGAYGNNGGGQNSNPVGTGGGGGGGAGEAGYDSGNVPVAPTRGAGGDGLQIPSLPGPVISPGIPSPHQSAFETAVGPTGWFAGGGAGQADAGGQKPGGDGGGGNGGPSTDSSNGVYGTGGGGGGSVPQGMAGGNGLIVLYWEWE